jgi:hypothetical protein
MFTVGQEVHEKHQNHGVPATIIREVPTGHDYRLYEIEFVSESGLTKRVILAEDRLTA